MEVEERKLWELLKKTGRREILEKLVEKYLPLVHYLANKLFIFTSKGIDKDELYSAGVMGLLDAIERFDLEKGTEFNTFASIRIRGSIIDEIRRIDWVPRSVRQKAKRLDSAIHSLFNQLGRMPSDQEIADELEISVEEYYHLTDNLGPLFLHSLESEVVVGDDSSQLKIKDVISDDGELSYEQKKIRVRTKKKIIESISQLPEKEKLVISLYYYEDLNLKEIGLVLGVSESRVSQMHSSALFKLRNLLKDI